MTITYFNFMKHAQKLSKSVTTSRPVLKGVNHLEGNLMITDSYRLYYVSDIYEGPDKNINPITGESIEGNYPDVNRLLPDQYNSTLTIKLLTDELFKAIKVIQAAGKIAKSSDLIHISLTNSTLTFSAGEESAVQCSYSIKTQLNMEDFTMTVNAKYLVEGLALFNDMDQTHIEFNYYSPVSPFTFTSDNLTVLILPVRRYTK